MLLPIIMIFAFVHTLGPLTLTVSASENTNVVEPSIYQNGDKIYIDSFEISYELDGNTYEITVKDILTGEESIANVDVFQETVTVDNQEVFSDQNNLISLNNEINSIKTYGPVRTNFNFNLVSLASVIATILGITVVVTAALTSGISLAVLKTGASKAWAVVSAASTADWVSGGWSIRGYYQYSQQVNTSTGQARNINRVIDIVVYKGEVDRVLDWADGSMGLDLIMKS